MRLTDGQTNGRTDGQTDRRADTFLATNRPALNAARSKNVCNPAGCCPSSWCINHIIHFTMYLEYGLSAGNACRLSSHNAQLQCLMSRRNSRERQQISERGFRCPTRAHDIGSSCLSHTPVYQCRDADSVKYQTTVSMDHIARTSCFSNAYLICLPARWQDASPWLIPATPVT